MFVVMGRHMVGSRTEYKYHIGLQRFKKLLYGNHMELSIKISDFRYQLQHWFEMVI